MVRMFSNTLFHMMSSAQGVDALGEGVVDASDDDDEFILISDQALTVGGEQRVQFVERVHDRLAEGG